MAVPCNIGRKEELQQLVAAVEERWGKVDILVCNAAINPWIGSTLDVEDATFRKVMETNLMGAHWLCQLVLPGMIERQSGHIVNISSIAGIEVYPNGSVYCASKHDVNAITKGLRIDLVKQGIRVSSISPGMAETEFSLVRYHGDDAKAKAVYQGVEPLLADDIADALEFIVTRPSHVMINDIQINPAQQANTYITHRKQF